MLMRWTSCEEHTQDSSTFTVVLLSTITSRKMYVKLLAKSFKKYAGLFVGNIPHWFIKNRSLKMGPLKSRHLRTPTMSENRHLNTLKASFSCWELIGSSYQPNKSVRKKWKHNLLLLSWGEINSQCAFLHNDITFLMFQE